MNSQHPDIVTRHIRTKNRIRKIFTYRSDDCELRAQHKKFNDFLTDRFIPSIFAKGYIKGRSIYHNALSHMYNDYFVMLDIKNFFPSICHKPLSEKIYREMNLVEQGQISKKECVEMVDICSIGIRGIPLGFITSPILSNIYLKEFDNIFYGRIKQLRLDNAIFTRYADDIMVSYRYSSLEKDRDIESQIIDTATNILSRYGLKLNAQKTRSYNLNISNHVKITGVNIIKDDSGRRTLTVGRSVKNKLFWDTLNCVKTKSAEEVQRIKGVQSFILSIEKCGYESCFSVSMMEQVHSLGYTSLKQLIDSL